MRSALLARLCNNAVPLASSVRCPCMLPMQLLNCCCSRFLVHSMLLLER